MHHINIVLNDIITFCHDILAIPTHGMEFAILNAHIQLNLVMHHSLSDVHRERRSFYGYHYNCHNLGDCVIFSVSICLSHIRKKK